MGKLTGNTALITDALQGVSEGVARAFAYHGADLILLNISPGVEKLADELCGRGYRCAAVVADVRDPASVIAAIKCTKEKEGRIDILVNNAGVYRLGSFLDMSDEDRDSHIDINIKGIWNAAKAVLSEMVARRDDRIVTMPPITGDVVADPGEMAYALTKVTIAGLAKSLTVEYVQSGVRVNAICSGYVHTPMAESIVRQPNLEDPEPVLTEVARAVPMRRLADPLEVGELAVFLVSDESSYLTGTQDVIDGGNTLPETANAGI